MYDVDCVIKHDVYPQTIHSCSKNIRGIFFCVNNIRGISKIEYIICFIAWIVRWLKDKMCFPLYISELSQNVRLRGCQ